MRYICVRVYDNIVCVRMRIRMCVRAYVCTIRYDDVISIG